MHSRGRRGGSSRARRFLEEGLRRGKRPAGQVRRLALCITVMALGSAGSGALVADASADGTVTLPGGPLVVSVGSLGECQSSYPNVGVNFYPPGGTLGDCGFFMAFPFAGNPTALQSEGSKGTVYGFEGAAGPHITTAAGGKLYTALKQLPTTGSGTTTDPYIQVTTFKVSGSDNKDYALVRVTTSYVNGQPQFGSFYDVQNITGTAPTSELQPAAATPLHFHAIAAGDLFVANDDHGTGVFLGGPPRFIGGQNAHTGTLGGFIESAPAWTNWQEGEWNSVIWEAVRNSPGSETVFNDTIDPTLLDNAAGVSWDEYLGGSGLAPGKMASFVIINRTQVPSTLSVQPVNQGLTVGQTGSIKVTATDNVGTPYAGRALVYSIGGSNPKTGSIITDSAGVATISYAGTNPGLDTIQMFLDLAGTGVQATQDPTSSAQITWAPAPPVPTSTYTVQSIHANPDGTITIVFVPTQSGAATLEVTVPTGTISRKEALAAKKKKCKKGQIKIKGKCRPKTTLSGKVSATGIGGVPLALTVKSSGKVQRALKRGRTVVLTATLKYQSALGGAPTVQVFHFTIKPKKKKHHH
jgi:hypothetical protein